MDVPPSLYIPGMKLQLREGRKTGGDRPSAVFTAVFPLGKTGSRVETRIGTVEGTEPNNRLLVGNRLGPLGQKPAMCPTALHSSQNTRLPTLLGN